MFKDRTLHFIFVSAIIFLLGTTVYFRFFFTPPNPIDQVFQAEFGSDIGKELSLQGVPETVEPGAVHVPILIYHSMAPHGPNQSPLQRFYDVAPESFIKQMNYLKDAHYSVISLDFLAEALDQRINLPAKPVVLTFDDGWRSQYSYAFPVLKKLGFTATFFIYTNVIDRDYFLTWDQVRLMNDEGMQIGGHTESHPYLLGIQDPAELRDEIIGGKHIIEGQIHQKIYTFAYPFGHYNDAIINVVKEAGYIAARSTYKGSNHTKADLYKLKGTEITDDFDAFIRALTD